ncbi:MAG: TonB-dependent siderophore receptor [Opitutales bacterium]
MIYPNRIPLIRIGLSGLAALGLASFVQAQEGQDTIETLSPFSVSDAATSGYRATNSTSGSRIDLPLREVPITLEVITEQFIDDTASFDLQESLRYTAGVTTSGDTGGRIRGFPMLWNQRNGFRRYDFGDAVNIQRVEVIKGSAGVLYGLTRPGGIVNYITKRPAFGENFGEVRAIFGSDSFYRAEVDANVGVNESLAFRVTASRTDTDDARTNLFRDINFVSPSLTWRPTPQTSITLEAEFVDREQVRDPGRQTTTFDPDPSAPSVREYVDEKFGFVGINDRYVHPDEVQTNDVDTYFLTIEHNFTENFSAQLRGYWIDRADREQSTVRRGFMTRVGALRDRDGNSVLDGSGNEIPAIGRHWANDRSLNEWQSYQLDLVYTLEGNNAEHRFLAGVYWSEDINTRLLFEDRDFQIIEDPDNPGTAPAGFRPNPVGGEGTGRPLGWLGSARKLRWNPLQNPGDLSINDPRWDPVSFQFPWLEYVDDIGSQAVFASYFGQWFDEKLFTMAGVRYEEADKTRASTGAVGAESPWSDDALAPQVGVIYNLTPNHGIYALYAESFDPQNGRSNSFMEQFDPLVGENTEFGFKGSFLENRYNYNIGFFHVDETNRVFFDPDIPNAGGTLGDNVAAGLVNSIGFDMSLFADITENLSAVFNMAYIRQEQEEPTEVVLDNFEGNGLTWNLWANYAFGDGALDGLSTSLGIRYLDEWDGFGDRVFGDQYIIDAAARYTFRLNDTFSVHTALNIKNLTDENDFNGGGWRTPREIVFTTGVNF